ncbi:VOC family protein [Streptomyces hebeiensis]
MNAETTESTGTTGTPAAAAPAIRYAAVTFDCADPAELARFYGEALALPTVYAGDDFIMLGQEGAPGLGFYRLPDYRPPAWPDPTGERGKQAHLELGVADLDEAEARLVSLGAVKAQEQPNPDRWRVLLDPAGHPFCVTNLA